MDIRIGNEIRINVHLLDHTEDENNYIKHITCVLKNTEECGCCNAHEFPQFDTPDDYTLNGCGRPDYNYNFINEKARPKDVPFFDCCHLSPTGEYHYDCKHKHHHHPLKVDLDKKENTITVIYPGNKQVACGAYDFELHIVLYNKSISNRDRFVTLDFGKIFTLVNCDKGKCGIQTIDLSGTLNESTPIDQSGENALSVQVYSQEGTIVVNGDDYITLVAEVWDGRDNITDQTTSYDFSWTRTSITGIGDAEWNKKHKNCGNRIQVPVSEIRKRSQFQCEFNFDTVFNNK